MAIQLPDLPFEKNALVPYISANTLDFHYGKHHKAYVDNINNLITWNRSCSSRPGHDHQEDSWRHCPCRFFQQRRTGMESYLLLAKH